MSAKEDFTVEVEDPDFDDGARRRMSDLPGWPDGRPRSRAYCRRVARQYIFEGATRADVVRVSDGEVVCEYTPENAPVAKMGVDDVCPLRTKPRVVTKPTQLH